MARSAPARKIHRNCGSEQAISGLSESWSVHRSLVGSLVHGGERYALNEGQWYRISKVLKDAADRKFDELCAPPDKRLRPLKKVITTRSKGKKSKTGYQSEGSYRADASQV
jgi:uncharacterized protein (TIGR04141 family)